MQNWLHNRSTSEIRALALTLAALLYSIFILYFQNWLNTLPAVIQVLGSTVSLALVVTLSEAGLLRWRAAAITGAWFYESASGNVGLGTISMSRGKIGYNFALYRSEADALADKNKLGHVTSPHTSFEDGFLWVNYKIEYRNADYPAREGCVVVTLPTTGTHSSMTGYWFSNLISNNASGAPTNSGELYFKRLKKGKPVA